MSERDQYQEGALPPEQQQPPVQPQQPQQGIDPIAQVLMQNFQLTQEQAVKLAQQLPQVCQGLQQGMEQGQQQQQPPPQQIPQQPPIPQETEGPILNSLDGIFKDEKEMEGFAIAMQQMGVNPDEGLYWLNEVMGQPDSNDYDIIDFFNSDLATQEEKFIWFRMTDKAKYEALMFAADIDEMVGFIANDSWNPNSLIWADDDNRSILVKKLVSNIMPRIRMMDEKKKKESIESNPYYRLLELPEQAQQMVMSWFPWLAEGVSQPQPTKPKKSGDSKLPQMDSITLDISADSITLAENGHLQADCVMAAAMVQDYKGKKVLKDPEELKKACDAARLLPITDEHPKEGIVMSQKEIKGWTTSPEWDEGNSTIRCSIDIFDQKLIDKIQTDGKTDVSIGFFCDLDDREGDWNDDKYSAVQTNIVLNHVAAGLDKGRGRCPNGTCGIQMDANGQPLSDQERAMAHFGITPEQWAALSPEEQGQLIANLPPRQGLQGQGQQPVVNSTDKDCPQPCAECEPQCENPVDEAVKAGKFELMPGRPDTHNHFVTLDSDGNGISSKNDSHTHTVVKFQVALANDHTHTLMGSDKEETPMSDEEKKQKKDEEEQKPEDEKLKDDKPADETPSNEEPKPEAETGSEGEDESEDESKPTEKDEADTNKKLKLVDSIMDFQVPKPREHYEGKALDELEEIHELLKATSDSVSLPSGSSVSAGRQAIDDAYADVEKKLQTK